MYTRSNNLLRSSIRKLTLTAVASRSIPSRPVWTSKWIMRPRGSGRGHRSNCRGQRTSCGFIGGGVCHTRGVESWKCSRIGIGTSSRWNRCGNTGTRCIRIYIGRRFQFNSFWWRFGFVEVFVIYFLIWRNNWICVATFRSRWKYYSRV